MSPVSRASFWLSRIAGLVLITWICGLFPALAEAQDRLTVVNARCGFGDKFKNGAWTPVWLQLKNGPNAFQGFLEFGVPDDDDVITVVRQGLDLLPGQERTITVYVRPGRADSEGFDLRFYDSSGYPVRHDAPRDLFEKFQGLTINDSIIVSLGTTSGTDAVKGLKEFAANPNSPTSHQIVNEQITVGFMPRDWRGYDGADVLILDATDEEVMKEFRSAGEAVREWVSRGGHLVVAVGTNWPQVRDSILSDMLPAIPNGTIALNEFSGLEKFANTSTPVIANIEGAKATVVAKLEIRPNRYAAALDDTTVAPMVVRGPYGFGVVTVTAIDVSANPFASWKARAEFWAQAASVHSPSITTNQAQGQAFYVPEATDFSTTLRGILDKFPGVQLVPFGWVAFFIFIYILLIGPGDYFFLKKVVKRMELTWITFPLIVAVVSFAAYYAAYSIKGRELLVNKIDLVDYDQEQGQVRGFSWLNVFSPENHDYNVGLVPTPIDKTLNEQATADLVKQAKPNQHDVLMSWFGAAENRFGGQNNPNRLSFANHRYHYRPDSDSRSLESVRVAMWSSKMLQGRWFGSLPAKTMLVDTNLSDDGNGLLGTLANVSERKLIAPILIYRGYVYELQDLEPGMTITLQPGDRSRVLSGYMGDKSSRYGGNYYSQDFNQAVVDRRSLVTAFMFYNSVGRQNRRLTSGAFRNVDLSSQLDLNRPILVAEVTGAGAALSLGRTPSDPKISQSTYLRILLPLGQTAPQAGAVPPKDEAKSKPEGEPKPAAEPEKPKAQTPAAAPEKAKSTPEKGDLPKNPFQPVPGRAEPN